MNQIGVQRFSFGFWSPFEVSVFLQKTETSNASALGIGVQRFSFFSFPRAGVNAIKLRADTQVGPYKPRVFSGCRGEPACSPWLNLMALTRWRGNALATHQRRVIDKGWTLAGASRMDSHAGASLPLSFRGLSFFEKKLKPRKEYLLESKPSDLDNLA